MGLKSNKITENYRRGNNTAKRIYSKKKTNNKVPGTDNFVALLV